MHRHAEYGQFAEKGCIHQDYSIATGNQEKQMMSVCRLKIISSEQKPLKQMLDVGSSASLHLHTKAPGHAPENTPMQTYSVLGRRVWCMEV